MTPAEKKELQDVVTGAVAVALAPFDSRLARMEEKLISSDAVRASDSAHIGHRLTSAEHRIGNLEKDVTANKVGIAKTLFAGGFGGVIGWLAHLLKGGGG